MRLRLSIDGKGVEFVTTAEAAAVLGVGVSTVKRWVDDRRIQAVMTVGRHRKIPWCELVRLARSSQFPNANLAALESTAGFREKTCCEQAIANYRKALVEGDCRTVRQITSAVLDYGYSMADLGDGLIAPTFRWLEAERQANRISVMHERRALQICLHSLGEVACRTEREFFALESRPLAMGGSPEHELDALPSFLVRLTLLENGWNAYDLGPNTPISALQTALEECSPRLIWINVAHPPPRAKTFIAQATELAVRCQERNCKFVLEGAGLDAELRRALQFSFFGDSLSHLASFAREIHPPPLRPRRGRRPSEAALTSPSVDSVD
jgi:MerR family transcriptional regulator, light-induced transcriptional regulator